MGGPLFTKAKLRIHTKKSLLPDQVQTELWPTPQSIAYCWPLVNEAYQYIEASRTQVVPIYF